VLVVARRQLAEGKGKRVQERGWLRLSLVLAQWGVGSWFERDGFFFCVASKYAKLPSMCVLWRPAFIGKNIYRFPNLVPQFLSFFVNLIFLIFLDFFINIDSNEKNQ
jgi:hypothetical protein